MKLIIAGSRDLYVTPQTIRNLLDIFILDPTEIVSGGARGIDYSAEQFARDYHYEFTEFPADWNTHGKSAGPIRNKAMAEYADILLLIWDGISPGSSNMKREMERLGKPIYEVILKSPIA